MLLTLPCTQKGRFDSDVGDTWDAANKRDLDELFSTKCCVLNNTPSTSTVTTTAATIPTSNTTTITTPSSRRWSFLTRRLSNCYELRRGQIDCDSVSPSMDNTPTVARSRRPNSVPVDPLPDAVPYLERYHVYRQPILLRDCILENLADGEVRFTSLRRALSLDNSGSSLLSSNLLSVLSCCHEFS